MENRIKKLFRKICNKLFLMLAQGIMERNPDGSIRINGDVIVYGALCAKGRTESKSSDRNSLLHKKYE